MSPLIKVCIVAFLALLIWSIHGYVNTGSEFDAYRLIMMLQSLVILIGSGWILVSSNGGRLRVIRVSLGLLLILFLTALPSILAQINVGAMSIVYAFLSQGLIGFGLFVLLLTSLFTSSNDASGNSE